MLSDILYEHRDLYDLEFYDYKNTTNRFLLLVGGVLLYTVGKPAEFIREFRKMRFDGRVSKFVTFFYDL